MGLDVMSGPRGNNRAVGYVRVSTGSQEEDGNSLAQQTRRIQRYAEYRGLRIRSRDIIQERGVSGGIPIYDRPSGALFLERVESGRYAHVISTRVDRMFRNVADAIATIDDLSSLGISIHLLDFQGQALDTGSATGRGLLQVVAAFAEMERGLISERTRDGMAYLRQNLLRFTRSLYGWNVTDGNRLVPSWNEQNQIDYMHWQMETNGISATAVARSLNTRGIRGKEGGAWQASSVLNTAYNDFHEARNQFPRPSNWSNRPWHRDEIIPENEEVED